MPDFRPIAELIALLDADDVYGDERHEIKLALSALEQRNAELERDARRYRWLRAQKPLCPPCSRLHELVREWNLSPDQYVDDWEKGFMDGRRWCAARLSEFAQHIEAAAAHDSAKP